jgi:DnaJ domain
MVKKDDRHVGKLSETFGDGRCRNLRMLMPHEVLGVSPDADVASIKRVFRTLAKEWHPDQSLHPNADARFREILSAYIQLIHRRAPRAHVRRAAVPSTPVAASIAFDDLAWEDRAPGDLRVAYPRKLARYIVAGTIGAVALLWISAFLSQT